MSAILNSDIGLNSKTPLNDIKFTDHYGYDYDRFIDVFDVEQGEKANKYSEIYYTIEFILSNTGKLRIYFSFDFYESRTPEKKILSIIDQIINNLISISRKEREKMIDSRQTVDRFLRTNTNQYLPEARDLIQKFSALRGGRKKK